MDTEAGQPSGSRTLRRELGLFGAGAMGRRGDMPAALGRLNEAGTTPVAAVVLVGVVVTALVVVGEVKTTWTFSAFTVLIYYALTNLSALVLPKADRRFPRWLAVCGLAACAFLAFWVPPVVWLTGLALLAGGLAWHGGARLLRRRRAGQPPT
jgi:APA family basic amino acid/polyamine antiporter